MCGKPKSSNPQGEGECFGLWVVSLAPTECLVPVVNSLLPRGSLGGKHEEFGCLPGLARTGLTATVGVGKTISCFVRLLWLPGKEQWAEWSLTISLSSWSRLHPSGSDSAQLLGTVVENVVVLEACSRILNLECLARSFTAKARESRNKDTFKAVL